MKYRDKFSIIYKILETCQTPVSKTKIMYDAYLSYTQLKEYMRICNENNLLFVNQGGEIITSAKGNEVYHLLEKVLTLIKN